MHLLDMNVMLMDEYDLMYWNNAWPMFDYLGTTTFSYVIADFSQTLFFRDYLSCRWYYHWPIIQKCDDLNRPLYIFLSQSSFDSIYSLPFDYGSLAKLKKMYFPHSRVVHRFEAYWSSGEIAFLMTKAIVLYGVPYDFRIHNAGTLYVYTEGNFPILRELFWYYCRTWMEYFSVHQDHLLPRDLPGKFIFYTNELLREYYNWKESWINNSPTPEANRYWWGRFYKTSQPVDIHFAYWNGTYVHGLRIFDFFDMLSIMQGYGAEDIVWDAVEGQPRNPFDPYASYGIREHWFIPIDEFTHYRRRFNIDRWEDIYHRRKESVSIFLYCWEIIRPIIQFLYDRNIIESYEDYEEWMLWASHLLWSDYFWLFLFLFWAFFFHALHYIFVTKAKIIPRIKVNLTFWWEWLYCSDFINIRVRICFNDELLSYLTHHVEMALGRTEYFELLTGQNPNKERRQQVEAEFNEFFDEDKINDIPVEIEEKPKEKLKHNYIFEDWLQMPYDYTFYIDFHFIVAAVLLKLRLFYLLFWGIIQIGGILVWRFFIVNFEIFYVMNFFIYFFYYSLYWLRFYIWEDLRYIFWKTNIFIQNKLLTYLFLPAHNKIVVAWTRPWKPLIFHLFNAKTFDSLPPSQPRLIFSLFSSLKAISILDLIGYTLLLSLNIIYCILWWIFHLALIGIVISFKIVYFCLNRFIISLKNLNFRYFYFYVNYFFAYIGLSSEIKIIGNFLIFLYVFLICYFFKIIVIILILAFFFQLYLYFTLRFFIKNYKNFLIILCEYFFFCCGFFVYYFFSLILFLIRALIWLFFFLLFHIKYVIFFVVVWYIGADWFTIGMLAYQWYIVIPLEWLCTLISKIFPFELNRSWWLYFDLWHWDGWLLTNASVNISFLLKIHADYNFIYVYIMSHTKRFGEVHTEIAVIDWFINFVNAWRDYSEGLNYISSDYYQENYTKYSTFKRMCRIFLLEYIGHLKRIYLFDNLFLGFSFAALGKLFYAYALLYIIKVGYLIWFYSHHLSWMYVMPEIYRSFGVLKVIYMYLVPIYFWILSFEFIIWFNALWEQYGFTYAQFSYYTSWSFIFYIAKIVFLFVGNIMISCFWYLYKLVIRFNLFCYCFLYINQCFNTAALIFYDIYNLWYTSTYWPSVLVVLSVIYDLFLSVSVDFGLIRFTLIWIFHIAKLIRLFVFVVLFVRFILITIFVYLLLVIENYQPFIMVSRIWKCDGL